MSEAQTEINIPQALRTWFVIHFATDMLFALPLMIAPEKILNLLGWQMVDPYATRVAAAALLGIGIESYLGRNAGAEAFRRMLSLKIIWSLSVILGTAVSLAQGAQGRPLFAWLILLVFMGFNFLWVYWRRKLDRPVH
jgi:hypothetical protein